MRACVQRVLHAQVEVAGRVTGAIERGMLVLLGIAADDTADDLRRMADKLVNLRIFDDAEGKMNLSLQQSGGAMLVVSQFTLFGDCRKGRRPSFVDAAEPQKAQAMYEELVATVRSQGVSVATGEFRQQMEVTLCNDGPITLLIDTRGAF